MKISVNKNVPDPKGQTSGMRIDSDVKIDFKAMVSAATEIKSSVQEIRDTINNFNKEYPEGLTSVKLAVKSDLDADKKFWKDYANTVKENFKNTDFKEEFKYIGATAFNNAVLDTQAKYGTPQSMAILQVAEKLVSGKGKFTLDDGLSVASNLIKGLFKPKFGESAEDSGELWNGCENAIEAMKQNLESFQNAGPTNYTKVYGKKNPYYGDYALLLVDLLGTNASFQLSWQDNIHDEGNGDWDVWGERETSIAEFRKYKDGTYNPEEEGTLHHEDDKVTEERDMSLSKFDEGNIKEYLTEIEKLYPVVPKDNGNDEPVTYTGSSIPTESKDRMKVWAHREPKAKIKEREQQIESFTNGKISFSDNLDILRQVWFYLLMGKTNDGAPNSEKKTGTGSYHFFNTGAETDEEKVAKHIINELTKIGDFAFSNMWEAFLIKHPNNEFGGTNKITGIDIVQNFFRGTLSKVDDSTADGAAERNFIRCQLGITSNKIDAEADVFRVKYAKVQIPEKKRKTITWNVGGKTIEVMTSGIEEAKTASVSIDSDSFLAFHQAILNQTNLLTEKAFSGNQMYTANRKNKYSLVVRFNSMPSMRYRNIQVDNKNENINWNNKIYVFEDVVFLGTGTNLHLSQGGGEAYKPEYKFVYRQSYWSSIEGKNASV